MALLRGEGMVGEVAGDIGRLAAQWLALGLLAGAGLGVGLDIMPAAVGSGAAIGLLASILSGRTQGSPRSPGRLPD
jgi:hypothetical protein